MVASALALLLALAPAAPAAAERVPAGSQMAALGEVTATISWSAGDFAVNEARLRIDRAGVPEFDGTIADVCDQCRFLPNAVRVVDLDGDGEPEVLVDAYSGGAHCCTVTGIYDRRPATSGYGHVVAQFGNVGYTLEDLDGDGSPELRSADDRFAYAFTAYAYSGFPIRVFDYRRAPQVGLVDVTRSFPGLVRADAADYLRAVRKMSRRDDLRGVLAAYVADEYLLGRGKTARAEIAHQRKRGRLGSRTDTVWPGGAKFEPALLKALQGWGYR